MKRHLPCRQLALSAVVRVSTLTVILAGCFCLTGCKTPPGADRASPGQVIAQIHGDPIGQGELSPDTIAILQRFDLKQTFRRNPDAALEFLHQKAVETGERDFLFALAELNFVEAQRLRNSVKRWDAPYDCRDYYLSSAVYAWYFIFQSPTNSLAFAFDDRFRTACDLYNTSLGWALTSGPHATDSLAILQGGARKLTVGQIDINYPPPRFPWTTGTIEKFVMADQFLVRGFSLRNRPSGLGAPLIAVGKTIPGRRFSRTQPITAVLNIQGTFSDLAGNPCRATLELYSPFVTNAVTVNNVRVPLEADLTAPLAYALNQSFLYRLGKLQFLSDIEQVPTGVYQTRPYQPGSIPVVFVHGTFSSPVPWSEMMNTLGADPVLRDHYQFWYFIYNSGNPIPYSAEKLRETLTAKIQEVDPEGKDPALQQMVVIGHSQGGLLTKMTATDTGDRLWRVVSTNRLEDLNISESQKALIRKYVYYDHLPFVKEVVFIATPHRGSFRIGGILQSLGSRFVALPGKILDESSELLGLSQALDYPVQLKAAPTSLDSMSPKNKFMLAMADIPVAPGIKSHSIIAVLGDGDYHQGNDGIVKYTSAHQDYTDSEIIVKSGHSVQDKPAAIEEVRRILRAHLADVPVP